MTESDSKLPPPGVKHDPFSEMEARALAKSNARTLRKLDDHQSLTPWNEWVAKSLNQEDWIVLEQPVESYRLPIGSERFLTSALTKCWDELTVEIQDMHNVVVGMRLTQAEVVLSGDHRIKDIEKQLRNWAHDYVTHRIAKTSYRSGGALKQFFLIHAELVPKLEEIAFRPNSANRCLLSELTDYIVTTLFEKTFSDTVEITFNQKELVPFYRVITQEPHVRQGIGSLVEVYQWQHLNDVSEILALTYRLMDRNNQSNWVKADSNREQILDTLQMLADDIQEMRPFLRHNFNPENSIVELAPDLLVSFRWIVGRGIGILSFAPSKAEQLVHLKNDTSALSLTLTHRGLLANFATPWIDSVTAPDKQDANLRANLFILEKIHAHLNSLFQKIDTRAVLDRFLRHAGPTLRKNETIGEEPTEEEFAALCQTIAEPVDVPAVTDTPGIDITIRAVRLQRLLQLLSDKLSCEVRQGKGSEIVLYRPGGHHFRLGHHKRNIYVPTAVIKSILTRLNITTYQWMDALS